MTFKNTGIVVFKLLLSATLINIGRSGITTFFVHPSMGLGIDSLFTVGMAVLGVMYLIMAVQLHFRPVMQLLKLSICIALIGCVFPLMLSTIYIIGSGGGYSYIWSAIGAMCLWLIPIGLVYATNRLMIKNSIPV